MLLIHCPYCGARPEIEFAYGGQSHLARPIDPTGVSDQEWADYLYRRANDKGMHGERWRHMHGCGQFFNVLRDTTNDRIVASYRVGEPKPAAGERG